MKRMLVIVVCLTLLIGSIVFAADAKVKAEWWSKSPAQKTAQKNSVTGTVTAVSATSISVQASDGVKIFAVAPKTRVMVAGVKAAIGDIKVGMQVTVNSRAVKDVLTAVRIAVPKPTAKGKITAIDGNAITLKGKQGEFHVTVTDTTKIRSRGYTGALADLRVGYSGSAQGSIANGVMTADTLNFEPATARGAVTAVDGTTVTIKTVSQLTFRLAISEKTSVTVRPRVGPNVKGTLADIKVGSPINAGYAPSTSGPSQALWIDVLTGA